MRTWISLALLLGVASCGGDDTPSQGECTPGEQKACACAGGLGGIRVCDAHGHFPVCSACAGAGGSGGSGGSGGGSGGLSGGGGVSGSGGAPGKHTGAVVLQGRSVADDQGAFAPLGATLMWAAWGYKNDPARLAQNLEWLSKHGFHYIRALGVVGDPAGADFWDGREIDWHWSDYDAVIAGLTDLAYDQYGLRVEWTLIGDGQKNIPDAGDRQALVDRFVSMSQGRAQKIVHFEIANEAWQNGFEGAAGTSELIALTQKLRAATPILVAASAPSPGDCAGAQQIYGGDVADLATIHFDRDIGQVEGHWRPVWQPWWVLDCQPALPPASNNEPIGPGASVSSENDPLALVSGALSTFVSGLPLHVFHSKAGVRGDQNVWEMTGADAFINVPALVPGDLASWNRKDPKASDSPLRVYAEEGGQAKADTLWPELASPTSGVVRAYGAVKGNDFVVLPIGIKDHVILEARQALSFDVIDPLTGAVVSSHSLAAGEQLVLSGAEARWLRGKLG